MSRRIPAADVEVLTRNQEGLPIRLRIDAWTLSKPVALVAPSGVRIAMVEPDGSVDWSPRHLPTGSHADYVGALSARRALGRYDSTLRAPLRDAGRFLDGGDRFDLPGSKEVFISGAAGRVLAVDDRPVRGG